ncbi:hypothetical protein ACGFH8_11850 [Micromonospora sp. NPDC049175]|uniref:hypothetical protein n=1 Tax=Micromonospora sp. NPDC049175 TaxID=3364266 RepID=UPI00371034BD
MADPLFIDASGGAPSYTAAKMRQGLALALMYDGRALGARSGVRAGGTGLTASLASSTITVQPGVGCIDPGLSTPQGPYWVAIPAAETHTLAAADASNPRKDIVILRVYDHTEDSSGLRLARTEYIAGVANPSPVRPTLLPGMLRLATIDVPKVGSGSAVVTNDAPYTVAAGGILPVRAAGDIAAGVAGRCRYRLDTGVLEQDTGTVWRRVDWGTAWGRVTGERYIAGATAQLAINSAAESYANVDPGPAATIAGRSYQINVILRVKVGTVGDYIFRIRDTNLSGSVRGYRAVYFPNTTSTYEVELTGYYDAVAGGTVQWQVTTAGAGSVTVYAGDGAATAISEVLDVGSTPLTNIS